VGSSAGVQVGDILLACDYGVPNERSASAAIFQVTGVSASSIGHQKDTGNPGNTEIGLVYTGTSLRRNGFIARFHASRWYVGNNSRGGRSLFQASLQNSGGVPVVQVDEIADGVEDMELSYLSPGSTGYVGAGAVADWNTVTAVRVAMTIRGQDQVGSEGQALERKVEQVIALRNRAL
jgi:type IV pilus assembly protein PilW